jgi:ABC-type sugar transport system ATPase subunit
MAIPDLATVHTPAAPLLEMRGIRKAFAGVQAVRGVDFAVRAGEIHGLVGENGAGKSTLMRILSGALPPDGGDVVLRGSPVRLPSPQAAQALGIAMIHQELSLVPSLSVAANVLLGHEPRSRLGLLQLREMQEQAARLMQQLETPVDVGSAVEDFGIAVQQMVEVAKALSHRASLIVMDEPTSSLAEAEVARLFGVIRGLRDRGVAIVYISHKMDEIYELCDRVTVLRDGEWVGTAATSDLTREQLIQWMVGRKIEQFFPKHTATPGAEVLRVEGMTLDADDGSGRRVVDGVSLVVRAGEIVGLAGLRGSGASELMGCIFGRFGARARGAVEVAGRQARVTSPAQAMRLGMALLTDDRKATGLVLPMSVLHNMTLASLGRVAPSGVVRRREEVRLSRSLAASLAVKARSLDDEVSSLSGGNQQKVALAKWLMTEPRVLLLDEPTRGVDVGAKTEVYQLMNRLVGEGKGILLTTSELPELLAMADRIIVLHRGRVTVDLPGAEATQERVMAAAMAEVCDA